MNEETRQRYREWIENATIKESSREKVDAALKRAMRNSETYKLVARKMGVPWTLLAALHEREASGNINRHPANGDHLEHKTVNDPAGLPRHVSPPFTYVNCADEELAELRRPESGNWTLEDMCYAAERFNGWAYAKMGKRSPYVVAATTYQQRGKFIADHEFDENHKDEQVGCLALWFAMQDAGLDVP